MFLFIFEDGSLAKRDHYEECDLDGCDDGFLDIIDIQDPNNPLRYDGHHDGVWVEVGTCTG